MTEGLCNAANEWQCELYQSDVELRDVRTQSIHARGPSPDQRPLLRRRRILAVRVGETVFIHHNLYYYNV